MKRWYTVISMSTLVTSVCGIILMLTTDSGPAVRASVSQVLIAVALVGVAITAGLRPAAQRAILPEKVGNSTSASMGSRCTFESVAANEQALQSLKELKDYLENPGKYARYGARLPRGVLLYGPPGTGKTLLARALAGEAGVPFFALSGSDFVEKYVGVGASRVRGLFTKARKAGRCAVFIDEIDAIGKRRDDSGSDERDQTLNALLSEMSGFHTGDGVIVIAATNRIGALDPALLRPGRFDRQIEVGLPGRDERLSILRLHSKGKPIAADVRLEDIAAQTISFSGAALEHLLNEAAIMAAQRDGGNISDADIQSAFCRTIAGADRPMAASVQERQIISIHESGHALASALLAPENRLARVSILPAGHGAAGYNLCIPAERVMVGRRHLENEICVLLAGRASEQLTMGEAELTAGASSDIARATELAAAMVTELGFAGEPAVSLKVLNRTCGGAGSAAETCRRLLNELYGRTCALLSEHLDALHALSKALVEAESLSGAQAEAIIRAALSNERQKPA